MRNQVNLKEKSKRKPTCDHIVIKMIKPRAKEKILRTGREKWLSSKDTQQTDNWFSRSTKKWVKRIQFSSIQFSLSVVSDSLLPHESQQARPPCPSPTPGAYSNSSPSSQWCHPAISSSVIPFSSCPHSLPASGSFPMSQLFAWGIKINLNLNYLK